MQRVNLAIWPMALFIAFLSVVFVFSIDRAFAQDSEIPVERLENDPVKRVDQLLGEVLRNRIYDSWGRTQQTDGLWNLIKKERKWYLLPELRAKSDILWEFLDAAEDEEYSGAPSYYSGHGQFGYGPRRASTQYPFKVFYEFRLTQIRVSDNHDQKDNSLFKGLQETFFSLIGYQKDQKTFGDGNVVADFYFENPQGSLDRQKFPYPLLPLGPDSLFLNLKDEETRGIENGEWIYAPYYAYPSRYLNYFVRVYDVDYEANRVDDQDADLIGVLQGSIDRIQLEKEYSEQLSQGQIFEKEITLEDPGTGVYLKLIVKGTPIPENWSEDEIQFVDRRGAYRNDLLHALRVFYSYYPADLGLGVIGDIKNKSSMNQLNHDLVDLNPDVALSLSKENYLSILNFRIPDTGTGEKLDLGEKVDLQSLLLSPFSIGIDQDQSKKGPIVSISSVQDRYRDHVNSVLLSLLGKTFKIQSKGRYYYVPFFSPVRVDQLLRDGISRDQPKDEVLGDFPRSHNLLVDAPAEVLEEAPSSQDLRYSSLIQEIENLRKKLAPEEAPIPSLEDLETNYWSSIRAAVKQMEFESQVSSAMEQNPEKNILKSLYDHLVKTEESVDGIATEEVDESEKESERSFDEIESVVVGEFKNIGLAYEESRKNFLPFLEIRRKIFNLPNYYWVPVERKELIPTEELDENGDPVYEVVVEEGWGLQPILQKDLVKKAFNDLIMKILFAKRVYGSRWSGSGGQSKDQIINWLDGGMNILHEGQVPEILNIYYDPTLSVDEKNDQPYMSVVIQGESYRDSPAYQEKVGAILNEVRPEVESQMKVVVEKAEDYSAEEQPTDSSKEACSDVSDPSCAAGFIDNAKH